MSLSATILDKCKEFLVILGVRRDELSKESTYQKYVNKFVATMFHVKIKLYNLRFRLCSGLFSSLYSQSSQFRLPKMITKDISISSGFYS
jgi:hypothetical protein